MICNVPVIQKRKFDQTIDMFQPEITPTLTPDLASQLRAWRDEPMYCKEHQNG